MSNPKTKPFCGKCQIGDYRTEKVVFKNGTVHYKAFCNKCNDYLKFCSEKFIITNSNEKKQNDKYNQESLSKRKKEWDFIFNKFYTEKGLKFIDDVIRDLNSLID
ncbi:MAG TPA: hypothetical protein VMZ91_15150 [Candidatus Paceibacterota bacterium]|nr:hypothetical protein [Candidatus Paceibacterota bacterium]